MEWGDYMEVRPQWAQEARDAARKAAGKDLGRRKQGDAGERRQWTASCRLNREEMEALIALCEERGTTRYTLIKTMILDYMSAATER